MELILLFIGFLILCFFSLAKIAVQPSKESSFMNHLKTVKLEEKPKSEETPVEEKVAKEMYLLRFLYRNTFNRIDF